MTISISQKFVILSVLALMLALPSFSHAATPDITALQSQYKLLVEQFETMKKRGMTASSTASTTYPIKNKIASSSVDRTCMGTAVDVRETSLTQAWTTYSNGIAAALTERKEGLVEAWSMDSYQSAVSASWKEWRTERKSLTDTLKKERKSAWETFKKTAKDSCRVTVPKEESLDKASSDSIVL